MVRKPTDSAFFGGIDVLHESEDVNSAITIYLFFLQHHEIEMLDALVGILRHALHERRLSDDLANVLVDERVTARSERSNMSEYALCYIPSGPQTKPLHLRLHDLDVGILPIRKSILISLLP